MRPKVWVITPELHRVGGTERCVAEQVERWRERFDLRLYTMRVWDVDLDGVGVRILPWLPGPHLLTYVWWLAVNRLVRWWDAVRLGPPDAVYSPGINATDADAISVHIVFGKYWERMRGQVLGDLRRPRAVLRAIHRVIYWALLRSLERAIYPGSASLWAISKEDSNELAKRFQRLPHSVEVVPYGVDLVVFDPTSRAKRRDEARLRLGVGESRVILIIGNDLHKKGADVAVAALRRLPEDVVLAAGGRFDENQLVEIARSQGVESRVNLWPHTRDVMDYFAAADILVAPSREDAFHEPALEALACGVPLVVSSRAGVAELLENERHALILTDPEDPKELAAAVTRILEDKELAEHLSVEGRILAEAYSWDRNAEVTAKLIEREISTPRVLVLAPSVGGPGGIERVSRSAIRVLAERYGADRIGLLTLGVVPQSVTCRVLASGKTDEELSTLRKLSYFWKALRTARKWKKNLIVVVMHPHLALVARSCSWISGSPYVVWCHGKEAWGRLRPSVQIGLRKANVILAGSKFTAQQLEGTGLPPERIRVLNYCVSEEVAGSPIDQTAAVSKARKNHINERAAILTVARLIVSDAYKGIDSLLCVWPRVISSVPEACLWVVGEGSDRARLQATAHALDLDSHVRFLGAIDDSELQHLYSEAKALALPSRFRLRPDPQGEGFGLVFIEAGASGLPVIAGRGGGTEDAVEHGKTGLLVDPDDPKELEDAIVRLLTDQDEARRMGEEGRRRAETEFSYPVFAERFCGVVDKLFASRADRRKFS